MLRDQRRRGWRTRHRIEHAGPGPLRTNARRPAQSERVTVTFMGVIVAMVIVGGACTTASNDLVDQALTNPEPASVFELQTGVCFNSSNLGLDGDITSIEVVTCTEPHRFQVFDTVIHDAPAGAPFDAEALRTDAQNLCLDGFARAVGRTFEDSPELELLPLRPSEASWSEAGDRTTYCIAYPGDETAFPDESLLGAG